MPQRFLSSILLLPASQRRATASFTIIPHSVAVVGVDCIVLCDGNSTSAPLLLLATFILHHTMVLKWWCQIILDLFCTTVKTPQHHKICIHTKPFSQENHVTPYSPQSPSEEEINYN